jgi:ParB/RepB/Spo0J family partition protein
LAPHRGRYTNHYPAITIPYNPLILIKKQLKNPSKKPKVDWYKKALKYQEMLTTELVKSQADLARKEGTSRARITQLLNLLKLPEEIKAYLNNIKDEKQFQIFTERRMREILRLGDPEIIIARFNQLVSKADKKK